MEDKEITVQIPRTVEVPVTKMVPRTVLVPVTVMQPQVITETESRTIQVNFLSKLPARCFPFQAVQSPFPLPAR
jgi:hypothetical protein